MSKRNILFTALVAAAFAAPGAFAQEVDQQALRDAEQAAQQAAAAATAAEQQAEEAVTQADEAEATVDQAEADAWQAEEEEDMTPEKMAACMEALGF